MAGGEVMLRIDDVDVVRLRDEYVVNIFETLQWLGIDWDIGPTCASDFYQTWSQQHRINRYSEVLGDLRANGKLFACTCTRSQIRATNAVAAGVHPSPVPYADFVTTTTHKTLRGPRGGMILCKAKYAKDIDRALFPGVQGGPLMHTIAAKAVCFKEALEPSFKVYQQQVVANAARLAEQIHDAGFRIVSGGTDNHLALVDTFSKGITGKAAEAALGKAGITVNKNTIPFDQNSPMVASGIRIGTPAVTTRGLGLAEMDLVAHYIVRALSAPDDQAVLDGVRIDVEALCRKFPLYPALGR